MPNEPFGAYADPHVRIAAPIAYDRSAEMVSIPHPSLVLAIVDDPASPHGRRMARVLRPDTPVVWIPPTLRLTEELAITPARVVALPLRVRGGHRADPFTAELMDALLRLGRRGCQVFVAQGPHPNALTEAGIPVSARPGGRYGTASEACVAAAEDALIHIMQSTGSLENNDG